MAEHESNVFDRFRPLRRLLTPLEAAQVQRFGRSALSTVFRADVLVLHTTGRRSGIERSTTLAYTRRGDELVVVGGAGGQSRIPDWVWNLRAAPLASVTVDRVRIDVRAREMEGDERAQIWCELVKVWPRIETYERRAGRAVPVLLLERVPS